MLQLLNQREPSRLSSSRFQRVGRRIGYLVASITREIWSGHGGRLSIVPDRAGNGAIPKGSVGVTDSDVDRSAIREREELDVGIRAAERIALAIFFLWSTLFFAR